jgi:adenylate cyclase class 2
LDVDALLAVLAARGVVMSAAVRQDDQAYAPVGWEYGHSKIGVPFARLRTENGRHLFTVKKPLDNEMACLEHESEISDREQIHGAMVAMGFYPTVRIVKARRSGVLGELSLCLDDVEHAGTYLEMERIIGRDESGVQAQWELAQFVGSLGVPAVRTIDTYDSLVRAAQRRP